MVTRRLKHHQAMELVTHSYATTTLEVNILTTWATAIFHGTPSPRIGQWVPKCTTLGNANLVLISGSCKGAAMQHSVATVTFVLMANWFTGAKNELQWLR